MITAVVVYESLLGDISSSIIVEDSLKDVKEELAWYCINNSGYYTFIIIG